MTRSTIQCVIGYALTTFSQVMRFHINSIILSFNIYSFIRLESVLINTLAVCAAYDPEPIREQNLIKWVEPRLNGQLWGY